MAKWHKPRAGSRAFWPKKRAARIYPNVQNYPKTDKQVPLLFAAYKAGMSRVVISEAKKESANAGQNVVKPVTVLDCPPLVVCGIKLYKKTIYGTTDLGIVWMDGLSKNLYRKTNIPKKTDSKSAIARFEKQLEDFYDVNLVVHTKPLESGIGKKKPELFEIPVGGKDVKAKWEYAKARLGTELRASDVFAAGEMIDAIAVTKGKGYQGPVKRFGIKIRSRKNEKKRRHVGSLGPQNPARVIPAKLAMAGQLGFQTRTEYNKRILKISEKAEEVNPSGGFVSYGLVKGSYILIAGSVPGPKKRLIMLRKAMRPPKELHAFELKKILLDSQN